MSARPSLRDDTQTVRATAAFGMTLGCVVYVGSARPPHGPRGASRAREAQALATAARAYVLVTGEVVLSGSSDALKADPRLEAAYLGGTVA